MNKVLLLVLLMLFASCAHRSRCVIIGKIDDVNDINDFSKIERVLDCSANNTELTTSEFTLVVSGKIVGSYWNTKNGATITMLCRKTNKIFICRGFISNDFGTIDITFDINGCHGNIKT